MPCPPPPDEEHLVPSPHSNPDSLRSRSTLQVGDTSYEIFRVDAVPGSERLPFSLKV